MVRKHRRCGVATPEKLVPVERETGRPPAGEARRASIGHLFRRYISAVWRAANTRPSLEGTRRMRTPVASYIALATAVIVACMTLRPLQREEGRFGVCCSDFSSR